MKNYFSVLRHFIFFVSFYWTGCSGPSSHNNNYLKQVDIMVKPSASEEIILSEWVDSIRFVPLEGYQHLVASFPHRFKIIGKRIVYLWCQESNNCHLVVFNLDGSYLYSIRSNPDGGPNAINTIHDADILEDSIFLLHDTQISVYTFDDHIEPKNYYPLSDFYSSLVKKQHGFIVHTQMLPYALIHLDQKGTLTEMTLEIANYPTSIPDRFMHFAELSGSTDKLFYHTYNPDIYKINQKTGQFTTAIDMDLGDLEISQNELNEMIHAGTNVHEISVNIINKKGKFLYYSAIGDQRNFLYLGFKINKKYYFILLDKRTNNYKIFSATNNDSGYPFLNNNRNKVVEVTSAFDDYLVVVLDPEFINYSRSEVSAIPKIPSNWEEVSTKIKAHSNPVLAYLKIKDNRIVK